MSTTRPSTRWTRRLALATAITALPLIAFGGSVTTLGAGLAVDGWLFPEGHFLWLFPADKWFRDLATFVEHSHRLFGSLVGLLAIAAAASAWRARGPLRWAALAALAAVCAQGAIGGLRVLERSPELAFLHGVLAQAVFASIVVACELAKPAPAARDSARGSIGVLPEARAFRRLAWIAATVLLAQAALGAWYRHGLRPAPVAGAELRLALHMLGALAAMAASLALAARALAHGSPRLGTLARRVRALLGVQIGLGLASWISGQSGLASASTWVLGVAHVVIGALLLSQVAALLVCAVRIAPPLPAHAPAGRSGSALAPPRPALAPAGPSGPARVDPAGGVA